MIEKKYASSIIPIISGIVTLAKGMVLFKTKKKLF